MPDRFCLAIEISNPSSGPRGRLTRPNADPIDAGPGVALARIDGADDDYLSSELLGDQGRHDDDLMPAIDRLCKRHSVRPQDLARIAVSIGPGGYTSIRIAIATAKMLAEATGAQVIAIESWRVAAAQASGAPGPTLVCLASKNDSAWAALSPEPGPLGVITAAELPVIKPAAIVADRFLPASFVAAASAINAPIFEPIFAARSLLTLAEHAVPIDPLTLAPLYPREADAVTQWRRLHP